MPSFFLSIPFVPKVYFRECAVRGEESVLGPLKKAETQPHTGGKYHRMTSKQLSREQQRRQTGFWKAGSNLRKITKQIYC